MFNPELTLVRYVMGWVHVRMQALRDSDRQSGALTLEWIIIAVALALIAGIAVAVFVSKVKAQDNKLP